MAVFEYCQKIIFRCRYSIHIGSIRYYLECAEYIMRVIYTFWNYFTCFYNLESFIYFEFSSLYIVRKITFEERK
jgi:hypothetical protein